MNENVMTVTFLSCFKCGRIVRSIDDECPRCGMKFGPGTLFECPFCAGLVWRSAEECSTCKTDLFKFAKQIRDGLESFSMDGFVDEILESELKNIRRGARRVACPSCGLMIRGDEDQCPRCDLPLEDAKVDCPVCGERVPISDSICWNCSTVFSELSFEQTEEAAKEIVATIKDRISEEPILDIGEGPAPNEVASFGDKKKIKEAKKSKKKKDKKAGKEKKSSRKKETK